MTDNAFQRTCFATESTIVMMAVMNYSRVVSNVSSCVTFQFKQFDNESMPKSFY